MSSSIALAAIALSTGSVSRGFFIEADLGVFVALGGRNTKNLGDADPKKGFCRVPAGARPAFPERAVSNLQPLVSLTAGYDLFTSDFFALSGGVRLSAAHANGAA